MWTSLWLGVKSGHGVGPRARCAASRLHILGWSRASDVMLQSEGMRFYPTDLRIMLAGRCRGIVGVPRLREAKRGGEIRTEEVGF